MGASTDCGSPCDGSLAANRSTRAASTQCRGCAAGAERNPRPLNYLWNVEYYWPSFSRSWCW